MTPREKAKGLVWKIWYALPSLTRVPHGENDIKSNKHINSIMHDTAKRCALIAVDAIIEDSTFGRAFLDGAYKIEYTRQHIQHWQLVKQEIEKL